MNKESSVDQNEVNKFNKTSEEWWDKSGEFKILHQINPIRIQYINDKIACEMILNKLARCNVSSIVASNGFKDLEEEEIKWKIFQGRAKYLENERISTL